MLGRYPAKTVTGTDEVFSHGEILKHIESCVAISMPSVTMKPEHFPYVTRNPSIQQYIAVLTHVGEEALLWHDVENQGTPFLPKPTVTVSEDGTSEWRTSHAPNLLPSPLCRNQMHSKRTYARAHDLECIAHINGVTNTYYGASDYVCTELRCVVYGPGNVDEIVSAMQAQPGSDAMLPDDLERALRCLTPPTTDDGGVSPEPSAHSGDASADDTAASDKVIANAHFCQ